MVVLVHVTKATYDRPRPAGAFVDADSTPPIPPATPRTRARRPEELPGVHRRHPLPAHGRRPRADPADVAHHPSRRRPVHRGLHRPRHAHAAGRRDRGPHRAGGPRGPRRARAARALRVDRRRVVRTFEANWDQVVEMVGEEVARVWRLYLVGGALAFEEGRMGVDQILMVKPTRRRPQRPAARCAPSDDLTFPTGVVPRRAAVHRCSPSSSCSAARSWSRCGWAGTPSSTWPGGSASRPSRSRRSSASDGAGDGFVAARARAHGRLGPPARGAHRRCARAATARTRGTSSCSPRRPATRSCSRCGGSTSPRAW